MQSLLQAAVLNLVVSILVVLQWPLTVLDTH